MSKKNHILQYMAMSLLEYFESLIEEKNDSFYVLYSDPLNDVRLEYPERN